MTGTGCVAAEDVPRRPPSAVAVLVSTGLLDPDRSVTVELCHDLRFGRVRLHYRPGCAFGDPAGQEQTMTVAELVTLLDERPDPPVACTTCLRPDSSLFGLLLPVAAVAVLGWVCHPLNRSVRDPLQTMTRLYGQLADRPAPSGLSSLDGFAASYTTELLGAIAALAADAGYRARLAEVCAAGHTEWVRRHREHTQAAAPLPSRSDRVIVPLPPPPGPPAGATVAEQLTTLTRIQVWVAYADTPLPGEDSLYAYATAVDAARPLLLRAPATAVLAAGTVRADVVCADAGYTLDEIHTAHRLLSSGGRAADPDDYAALVTALRAATR